MNWDAFMFGKRNKKDRYYREEEYEEECEE